MGMNDPMWGSRRPAAIGLALLLFSAILLAACARPIPGAGPGPEPDSGSDSGPGPGAATLAGCPQAPLPAPGAEPLSGPAVASLTGGAAHPAFSVDGGALTVDPPRPGDHPAITAATATCEALASDDTNGASFGDDARAGGLAYGYGRVSVDGRTTQLSAMPGPAAPAYRDRLAWVVVVKHLVEAACPLMTARPSPVSPPTDYYAYELFLIDAATGGDALAYTEGGVVLCGSGPAMAPQVSVPTDRVSVPWRLVSRDTNGYAATIEAQTLPCDRVDPVVLPDEYTPSVVQVVVDRRIGPACGQAGPIRLSLHAATVTSNLPAVLVHAPTGLILADPPAGPPPSGAAPQGPLQQVEFSDCGRTIEVTVDTVLVMPAIPDLGDTARYPVVSSDPAVVGPLDQAPTGAIAELRAWHPGHADLTVTGLGPDRAGLVAGCAKPWVLHVTVR
jgi:hypothetical protein